MKRKLILCVDDEKVILSSLIEQLQHGLGNQFLYEIAQSAEEAWEIIEDLQNEIEMVLIISDWLMPGMKGDEFLIRLHEKYPEVVTIMLTGQADESSIKNAIEHANLYACLRKPWDKDDLIHNIKTALKMYNKMTNELD
ncbi:MAG: response regulator [Bacteroidia bacterium]|nr:response regulator [Bacteroidia bacterium]MDW8346807.1 response regulator [Bacteroidia bacterium]